MAFPTKLLAILLVALLASPFMVSSSRKLESKSKSKSKSKSSLLARLKVAEEGPSSCWDALMEIQSCSGEVVMFFLNGEAHLGDNCCGAIRVIEQQCWPSMLGTLGITTEETNVLRGYCDATATATPTGSAAASPPPASAGLHQCYDFPRLRH